MDASNEGIILLSKDNIIIVKEINRKLGATYCCKDWSDFAFKSPNKKEMYPHDYEICCEIEKEIENFYKKNEAIFKPFFKARNICGIELVSRPDGTKLNNGTFKKDIGALFSKDLNCFFYFKVDKGKENEKYVKIWVMEKR